MIGALVRKDWALLWPLVLLAGAIQLCWEWSQYSYGFFGGVGDIDRALSALSLAWLGAAAALAAAVVQTDAPPSANQDWLIRPIPRTELLLAKLLFVALTIGLPSVMLDWVRAAATGFAPAASLGAAVLKAALLYVFLLVPVMALAATVVRMTDLLALGAAVIVVYGVVRSTASALLGADACPTCGTGFAWIQHLWQHLEILLGAVAILALQYSRRGVIPARLIALVGTVVVVIAQPPWGVAFALQRQLAPSATAKAAAVQESVARTRDVIAGDSGAAGAGIPVELSLRVAGIASDELLLIDRSEILYRDVAGKAPSRHIDTSTLALAGGAQSGSAVAALQTMTLSRAAVRALSRKSARLLHWMTLMDLAGAVSLPGHDGTRRSAYAGRCASRLSADGTAVSVRCHRLGAAPICVTATLYGARGQHDPTVVNCQPDYRPYLPVTDIFTAFGVDVPLRDPSGVVHLAVDPTELDHSTLQVDFYTARAHLRRDTALPAPSTAHEDGAAQ